MAKRRMRTIRALHAEIVANDPNTCITQWFIREAVLSGRVPCVRAGNKYLIDADKFNDFLAGGDS